MLAERLKAVLRNLAIPIFLSIASVACVGVAVLVLVNPVNNGLNPLESFALRLSLSSRTKDLETPMGSDPTAIRFVIDRGDTASAIGKKLLQDGFVSDADLFRNYVRY